MHMFGSNRPDYGRALEYCSPHMPNSSSGATRLPLAAASRSITIPEISHFRVSRAGASFSTYGYPGPYGFNGFYGYPFGGPWISQTVIVMPAPIIVVPQPIIIPVQAEAPVDVPQVDPKKFLVIKPDRPNAAQPARVEKKVEKKVKEVELGIAPGELPLARAPATKPRVEADRQIESGREAFANGEYGRALECFRRAVAVLPDEASAWFLLAQTQFAVGKYDAAIASIGTGLKVEPEWPGWRLSSRKNISIKHGRLRQTPSELAQRVDGRRRRSAAALPAGRAALVRRSTRPSEKALCSRRDAGQRRCPIEAFLR